MFLQDQERIESILKKYHEKRNVSTGGCGVFFAHFEIEQFAETSIKENVSQRLKLEQLF